MKDFSYEQAASALIESYNNFVKPMGFVTTLEPSDVIDLLQERVEPEQLPTLMASEFGRGLLIGYIIVIGGTEEMDYDGTTPGEDSESGQH